MKLFEKSSMSLMNKIIVYFVGYTIVVMFLFSLTIYLVDYSKMNLINASYSRDIAELEADMVNNWLDDSIRKLNDISIMAGNSQNGLMTNIEGLIDIQQQNKDNFRHLYLVNTEGEYIDTFGQEANMNDEIITEIINGEKELVVTSPMIHPILSEALFNVIVPVYDGTKIIGVLGATVTMDQLSKRLNEYEVSDAGFGWLVDENLTVIAHPEEDNILNMSLYSTELIKEKSLEDLKVKSANTFGYSGLDLVAIDLVEDGYATGKYTDLDGYNRTVSFVKVNNAENWYVGFTTFDDKIPSSSRSLLIYMVIGVALIVAITIFATYLLASEVTKPINQLIHVVNLFIGGNSGVRAKVDTDDEFGKLGKAFNGMADTIIEHTDNVEALIKERTYMLADLNYQIVVRNKELNTMNEELETTNDKLHSLATTDMLTGLYNRHELVRSMQTFMDGVLKSDDAGFSVLFIDLDNFKYYNDTFSHEIGDFLLIEIAKILKANIRDNDIVARYGGDEFVVLLKHGDFDVSKMISERIHAKILEQKGFRKAIERKIKSEILLLGKNMLSCSIGIVNYNKNINARTVEELLALADDTMYKAKKQGKSRIVVS